MKDDKRLKEAKERAKKRAEEIFKAKPKDIEAELEKESVLGNPKNLVRPDNVDE